MPRRILILNERDPTHPLAGGAETHVYEIFSRLAERGHEITHLAASYPGSRREEIVQGVRVRRLADRHLYYWLVPRAARQIAAEGCDVVVDTLNKLPFLSPWFVPVPCMAIVHHLFGTTAFKQASFPIALVTWLSEKLIPMAYRGVPMLAISPSTRDDLAQRGVDPTRVGVVPPGVDPALYREPLNGGKREPLIAWIGRLEPYKRADTMIDAMEIIRASLPAARLIIVGAGSAREELEARATARGLGEAVEFTGFISEEEKVAVLQRACVIAQTSEKEGWGMTVIEGNACGTPAVATRVPGLQDAVRDGVSGLLVPYADVQALAEASLKIITDASLHQDLVRGGLKWAERFSWDRVADDTEALIEEAIHPSGRLPLLSASPFGPEPHHSA
jgi:glycosyltransferase involved in cell wall biosynthesis